MNDPVLKAVATELVSHRFSVLRFNFPYRESGRKAPGAQRDSEDCYRAIVDFARSEDLPVFCGGKSYGGRMATHIAADGEAMHGLVLLSYPLHPPGRFDKLRDQHLGRIEIPMLFIQGTKDTFARRDLLEATLKQLALAQHVPIEAGEHSLRVRGRKTGDVAAEIAASIASFVEGAR